MMLRILSLLIGIGLSPGLLIGATTNPSEDETSLKSWAPYCGLYSLYAAAKLEGHPCKFQSLIRPEYCGSADGSTLAELIRAAEEHGLHALALKEMTGSTLETAKFPIILHVKNDLAAKSYNHYVLFVGMEGDKARILDAPHSIRAVGIGDLMTLWDGNGLVISNRPISDSSFYSSSGSVVFLLFSIAAALQLFGQLFNPKHGGRDPVIAEIVPRRHSVATAAAQMSWITFFAIIAGLIFQMYCPQGLLAGGTVAQPFSSEGVTLQTIDATDLERLLKQQSVFLIDARYPEDFNAGHIVGAVDVPPSLDDSGRLQLLKDVSHEVQIVVYCQSYGCPYSRNLASNLIVAGYKNIVIYENGWMDWKTDSRRAKLTAP